MASSECVTCRKSFSRKDSLIRHINNRKKSCFPATHHCAKCDKGLSSYQSLWQHRCKCQPLSVEQQSSAIINNPTKNDDVTMDSDNYRSTSMIMRPLKSVIIVKQYIDKELKEDNVNNV